MDRISLLTHYRIRVKEMVESTSDGKIPLSFDYCIRADLLTQSSSHNGCDQINEMPPLALDGLTLEDSESNLTGGNNS